MSTYMTEASTCVLTDVKVTFCVTTIVETVNDREVTVETDVYDDVYMVAAAQVDGHADAAAVIVIAGKHEDAESVLLEDVVVELPPVIVGESVLLDEVDGEISGEDLDASGTKQLQALLIFELDAEHFDRKVGKAEVAVTRLVV
jgi:hypothetical protein